MKYFEGGSWNLKKVKWFKCEILRRASLVLKLRYCEHALVQWTQWASFGRVIPASSLRSAFSSRASATFDAVFDCTVQPSLPLSSSSSRISEEVTALLPRTTPTDQHRASATITVSELFPQQGNRRLFSAKNLYSANFRMFSVEDPRCM